jgi:hypothetical protein
MLSLTEAWQWVQVGFCAGVGTIAVLIPLALIGALRRRSPEAPWVRTIPPPHCSRCCPVLDAGIDELRPSA